MAAVVSAHSFSEGGDEGGADAPAGMYAGYVDQQIRQGVQFCWMALPKDRKNPQELQKQVQRIVDRALKDFKADMDEFSPKE